LKITASDLEILSSTMNAFFFDVLALQLPQEGNADKLDAAVQVLIDLRMGARADKNWALSDEIRDKLADGGIMLKDGKDGTTYSVE
jgi:cysteinyl-tRNA synthetase